MQDSKAWEEAYSSYKKSERSPSPNHRKPSPVKQTVNGVRAEPMILVERYIQLLKEIKDLTKEKNQLKKRLKKDGIDPTIYTHVSDDTLRDVARKYHSK